MNEQDFERAGLYDPAAPNAADRLALLTYLAGKGITIEEMVERDREGYLTSLAADTVLMPAGELFTAAEVAERTGIPSELGIRIWRAAGFADPGDARIFTRADQAAVSNAGAAFALFGEEASMQFVRVLGSSLARIADAMLALFESNVGAPMRAAEASAIDVAHANVAAAELVPMIAQTVDPLLRHHMMAARRRRWAAAVGPTTPMMRIGVGFADLVGFTGWTHQVTGSELARAMAEFEAAAIDIASSENGRVVKTIGDEVMFVASDAAAVCRIARALVATFVDHPRVPPLRAGLALGEALPQDGDYFGEPVNLAARIVKAGEPSEVLVDGATAASVDAFAFESVGARALKGFDEPVELFRLV